MSVPNEFEFIETEIFTRRVLEVLADAEYAELQADLVKKPDAGVLIPGGKGLRKLRWALEGKGKSGGLRVIYYLVSKAGKIYMIYLFRKSDQADLKPQQLRILSAYLSKKGSVL